MGDYVKKNTTSKQNAMDLFGVMDFEKELEESKQENISYDLFEKI